MLILNNVDWSGRHEDSCGITGQGRHPAGAKRRGGSPNRPRTACAWSGNKQPGLTEPSKKRACGSIVFSDPSSFSFFI
ncbi:hypothetical protein E2K98_07410 [Bacillus salipaludis]|uniref:Uncharacterized protein n=1 Tax=Bacillus salipaludis TaxID=2547811 RepID=A0A4R5VW46_9BACI|nr:hypothetical protein E2K98_07410 [Bacillus salipaludis]